MPRASKGSRSRRRPLDITDIMRPTAGVIEFDNPSNQSFTYTSHDWSSTPSPASSTFPITPTDDAAWNLIPYHIPWGPEYHDYRRGKLPGPEGDCIFLRSPTPVKNQRTSEACKKCRERKAKCSGEHPTCGRCAARGFACEYASAEHEDFVIPNERKRKRQPSVASTASSSSSSQVLAPCPTIVPSMAPIPQSYARGHAVKYEEPIPAYCQSPIPAPYWNSPRIPDANEEWSGVYPSSHGFGDAYPVGAMYGLPLYYGHRIPSPAPSIYAPQPIRRSSVGTLEMPTDASSDGSYSSAGTDVSGAFMSGTMTPLTSGSSVAPSPGAEYVPASSYYVLPSQHGYIGLGAHSAHPLDDVWVAGDHTDPYYEDITSSAPNFAAAYVSFT
ncbi:hypothetical protein PENSPDRAFT_689149 [Peniophora sp. CONT]|nr:hypothetical protein PENSPDRAFT_689149 [Peniophora sp. CONT]